MHVWSWFQKSPARQEDFENIVNELNDTTEKSMLYFSCTRWVLLGKVIERLLSKEKVAFFFYIYVYIFPSFTLEQFDLLQ